MKQLPLTEQQSAQLKRHMRHGYTLLGRIMHEQFDGSNATTCGRLVLEYVSVLDSKLPALRAAIATVQTEAPKQKKPKAPKPPTIHAVFIERWMSYYETRFGIRYPFTPRDAAAAKGLLKHHETPEAAFQFIEACHKRIGDGFPFANSTTLYDLYNNLARLTAALKHGTNSKTDRNIGTRNEGSGQQYRNVGAVAPVAATAQNIFGATGGNLPGL